MTRRGPRYPRIEVQLIGEALVPFKLVNKVRAALERGGVPADQVRAFTRDAVSDDLDHLIATCARWVTVL
jgi:hypothetical protein